MDNKYDPVLSTLHHPSACLCMNNSSLHLTAHNPPLHKGYTDMDCVNIGYVITFVSTPLLCRFGVQIFHVYFSDDPDCFYPTVSLHFSLFFLHHHCEPVLVCFILFHTITTSHLRPHFPAMKSLSQSAASVCCPCYSPVVTSAVWSYQQDQANAI